MTFAALAVTLDGRPVLAHARAAIVGGRALLPVRSLAAALGADVRYDETTHGIVIRRGSAHGVLSRADGVRLISGHAYAPLRAASGALGVEARYDAATRTVALRTPAVISAGPVLAPASAAPTALPTVYAPYPVATARLAPPAALTPAPIVSPSIVAIGLDRVITPGTAAFDVIVQGVPGLFGWVAVDGIGSRFPLQVIAANAYAAHVVVPRGLYVPFAHVGARIQLPDGSERTLILPQTITLMTVSASASPPPSHKRRPLATASPSPSPSRR